jgi:hypothetical protein
MAKAGLSLIWGFIATEQNVQSVSLYYVKDPTQLTPIKRNSAATEMSLHTKCNK